MSSTNDGTMQVLVLGLPRTGTLSIRTALVKLGYKNVYHMMEVLENPNHADIWSELATKKFAGKTVTRDDFDRVLKGYEAVSDLPCCAFVPELIKAYPNCKVVLSTRDPSKWVTSMSQTVIAASRTKLLPRILAHINAGMSKIWRMIQIFSDEYFPLEFERDGVRFFNDHTEELRRCMAARPGDYLEHEAKDGWEPLCKLLGHKVPEEPYPYVNDSKAFEQQMGQFFRRQWEPLLRRVVAVGLAAATFYYASTWALKRAG